jgi:hypothetical protein
MPSAATRLSTALASQATAQARVIVALFWRRAPIAVAPKRTGEPEARSTALFNLVLE